MTSLAVRVAIVVNGEVFPSHRRWRGVDVISSHFLVYNRLATQLLLLMTCVFSCLFVTCEPLIVVRGCECGCTHHEGGSASLVLPSFCCWRPSSPTLDFLSPSSSSSLSPWSSLSPSPRHTSKVLSVIVRGIVVATLALSSHCRNFW
jgi:hypothetical protein